MGGRFLAVGAVLVLGLASAGAASASPMDDDSFLCTAGVGLYKVQKLVALAPDLMTPLDALLGCEPWIDD